MPKRDGTGPAGSGNYGGKMGGPVAGGPQGNCVCPKCGTRVKHERGVPCTDRSCPECGTKMTRA